MDASAIDALTRHPLVIVVVTALVSGYLVPRLTQWWQDHQKEIETRAKVASDVVAGVVKIIVATQIAERQAGTQEAFDNAYRQWEVDRAVLESQLRAYFATDRLAKEWARLSDAVTNIYVLTGVRDTELRNQHLAKLQAAFELTDEDRLVLLDFAMMTRDLSGFHTYGKVWWKLREGALTQTSAFAPDVLGERTTLRV